MPHRRFGVRAFRPKNLTKAVTRYMVCRKTAMLTQDFYQPKEVTYTPFADVSRLAVNTRFCVGCKNHSHRSRIRSHFLCKIEHLWAIQRSRRPAVAAYGVWSAVTLTCRGGASNYGRSSSFYGGSVNGANDGARCASRPYFFRSARRLTFAIAVLANDGAARWMA